MIMLSQVDELVNDDILDDARGQALCIGTTLVSDPS
jgi:hypothetical protein